MQLSVSGKHLDVGDSLRGHVASAIAASAERYFGRAIEGKVVFQRDRRRAYRADISLHVARGIMVQSHGEAADPYAAFDAAAERLDKRLRRYKRRLVDRRRAGEDAAATETAAHFIVAPPADARDTGEDEGDSAAASDAAQAVVAETPVDIDVLSVQDAVMRLDLAELPVLLFRNRRHGGYNVVYRRPDGAIGWIDPPPQPRTRDAAAHSR